MAARVQDDSKPCPQAPLPAPAFRFEPTGSALIEPGCATPSTVIRKNRNKIAGRLKLSPASVPIFEKTAAAKRKGGCPSGRAGECADATATGTS